MALEERTPPVSFALVHAFWTHALVSINVSLLFPFKPGSWVKIAVGGASIQIVHYFDNGYLEEEKINDIVSQLLLEQNI